MPPGHPHRTGVHIDDYDLLVLGAGHDLARARHCGQAEDPVDRRGQAAQLMAVGQPPEYQAAIAGARYAAFAITGDRHGRHQVLPGGCAPGGAVPGDRHAMDRRAASEYDHRGVDREARHCVAQLAVDAQALVGWSPARYGAVVEGDDGLERVRPEGDRVHGGAHRCLP